MCVNYASLCFSTTPPYPPRRICVLRDVAWYVGDHGLTVKVTGLCVVGVAALEIIVSDTCIKTNHGLAHVTTSVCQHGAHVGVLVGQTA